MTRLGLGGAPSGADAGSGRSHPPAGPLDHRSATREAAPLETRRPTHPHRPVMTMSDITAIGLWVPPWTPASEGPGELSIVGFDDIPAASWTSPRLTTVHQPIREKGRTRRASAHLGDSRRFRAPPVVELLPTRLVVRGSSGAARQTATGTAEGRRCARSRIPSDPHRVESYTGSHPPAHHEVPTPMAPKLHRLLPMLVIGLLLLAACRRSGGGESASEERAGRTRPVQRRQPRWTDRRVRGRRLDHLHPHHERPGARSSPRSPRPSRAPPSRSRRSRSKAPRLPTTSRPPVARRLTSSAPDRLDRRLRGQAVPAAAIRRVWRLGRLPRRPAGLRPVAG